MEASESKATVARTALTLVGIGLLAAWSVWWGDALHNNRLRGARFLWLPIAQVRGIDFYVNYFSGRAWVQGSDPYRDPQIATDHPYGVLLNSYPPPCIWQFAWCVAFNLRRAKMVWLLASMLLLVVAAIATLRVRRDLNLWCPPWPFALACVLFSSPVVFELERGQSNVLVLLHLLLAVAALRRRDWLGDATTGLLIALAFWTKIYPLILLCGLLPLRRWRAFGCGVVFAVLMALADLPGLAAFQRNLAETSPIHRPLLNGSYAHWQHALGAWWTLLWRDTSWERVGSLPELLSASCLLLPILGVVSLAVFRLSTAARQRITLPYFLWLTGVGTFLSPMAYDYCLCFLPLAVLAVWDRRDPVVVTLLMGVSMLWLQPLSMPVSPLLFMGFKLALVGALTLSLLTRCRELAMGNDLSDLSFRACVRETINRSTQAA